jgi:uncharacterized protein (TIGR02391 family)
MVGRGSTWRPPVGLRSTPVPCAEVVARDLRESCLAPSDRGVANCHPGGDYGETVPRLLAPNLEAHGPDLASNDVGGSHGGSNDPPAERRLPTHLSQLDGNWNDRQMKIWEHTAQELLELPLPDLSLLVLADFKEGGGWNQWNWLNSADQMHRDQTATSGVMERLAEAWSWLDSRTFVSRLPGQNSPDSRRVSSEGERALAMGLGRLHAAERLEGELLPDLGKAKRQFLQGDYEEAVFAAFRKVEEVVRERSGMAAGDLGVSLMRKAFKPDGGPLADQNAEAGEKEALSGLFAGALGTFKNPSSHRTVTYDDPMVAAEAVLLADLLLRLLNRRSVSP